MPTSRRISEPVARQTIPRSVGESVLRARLVRAGELRGHGRLALSRLVEKFVSEQKKLVLFCVGVAVVIAAHVEVVVVVVVAHI